MDTRTPSAPEGAGGQAQRYPSDLTDEEWLLLQPLLPRPVHTGRPRRYDLREMINALRYLVRSGFGWRMLLLATLHEVVLMLDREFQGRTPESSAGVLDSQSVKAPQADQRGFDGGKKITGRKSPIAVDTDGQLLMVHLTSADVADSTGAIAVLDAARHQAAVRRRGL